MSVNSRALALLRENGVPTGKAIPLVKQLSASALLANTPKTGYMLEIQDQGRWWRINGWIYTSLAGAEEMAINMKKYHKYPMQIVEINHTEPTVARTL